MKKIILGLLSLFILTAILTIAYTGTGKRYFPFLDSIPGGDKTGHFVLMAFFSVVLSWLLNFRGKDINSIRLHWGALTVGMLISLEELTQLGSPYRTFDLGDGLCNLGGVCAALLFLNGYQMWAGRKTVPAENSREK